MSEESQPNVPGPKELSGRIGKYEIVGSLGKGAMGMVYRAHDTMLDRDVALKVMMASIADDEELQKRFEREAKAVGKMNHPNVVTVFDRGYHTDGSPYIAMELLEGADLQKTMRKQELSLERKVSIIVQVLSGLSHAHSRDIVHRDIKPANIWIKSDGAVKIMDFGVARLTAASMTGTGAIVGTADYMSPEQVKGARVDGRSDVFSVGCMLFELLAGHRPFRADNLMAIFYKITHDQPGWEAIPTGPEYEALMPLLHKALAKELDDRYQSAYDFAVDLREYLKSHATSAAGREALEEMAEPEPLPEGVGAQTQTDSEALTQIEGGAATQLETGRARRSTVSGTAATVASGTAATVRATVARPTVRARTAATRTLPQPMPASSGSPVLYVALGGLLVVALGLGGYVYMTRTPAGGEQVAASSTLATTPTPAPTPEATPEPPPPTAAAPPPTVSAEGRAAATVRAAQTAFDRGDYDRAVTEAQRALRTDPQSRGAKTVLDNALKGQQAAQRFAAADAALRAGNHDQAIQEAEAGSRLAPWDGKGPDLINRARAAQRRAAQQAEEQQRAAAQAELNGLLQQAETALAGKQYDDALALYDRVLERDAGNTRASQGRTAAVAAKALADAAASAASSAGAAASGRGFVLGDTVAQAKRQADAPPGFETGDGIQAKAATAAAATPGLLSIKISPAQIRGGDKYTVQVDMLNQGSAPIQIQDMIVTTTVNGRRSQGPVPPQVREVAPQQTAMLLQLAGNFWREDTEQWSMQVMVRTVRGESYRNTIEWK